MTLSLKMCFNQYKIIATVSLPCTYYDESEVWYGYI